MKPLSPEAVKRLALQHGGKLEINGQKVNSARVQVATAAPKPKPAAPAYMPPAPAPAQVQTIEAKPDPAVREAVDSIERFAASQFLINESNAQFAQAVKEMLQKTPVQDAPRPKEWIFRVKRDAHGLMETITAKAVY